MNRREYLASVGVAGTVTVADFLSRDSMSERVFPMERMVLATNAGSSPSERSRAIAVFFRSEREEGGFEYARPASSPVYDDAMDAPAFVEPPAADEPLTVDDDVHDWLTDRFENVRYAVHACAVATESDDRTRKCRSYRLDRAAFNAFTLADAILVQKIAAGEPSILHRVYEGEGLLSERV